MNLEDCNKLSSPALESILLRNDNIIESKDVEGQIEIQTRSGYRILVSQNPGSRQLSIKCYDTTEGKENPSIEIVPARKSMTISTQMDVHIKADNIEIEATADMKLTSGATMTLNGSLIKLN